ncbi:hypothetical protein Goshw_015408 [Gossypium schwendimanii]|uniref:O-methyltransferase C-terminal domain-containing protein n=1 Tax=Gossypium schwendimanii TaxID=34291 RepID=A0A7J9MIG1_GOSSC|nr:hypothetical protein [Gossypium schwendimanii]
MIISKYPSIKGINYDCLMLYNNPHLSMEVLHNWDDEHCLKLLRNCYEALEEKGKVIVISYRMSEEAKGNAAKFISQMDLHIATGFGAKQFESMAMDLTFQAFNSSALISMLLLSWNSINDYFSNSFVGE